MFKWQNKNEKEKYLFQASEKQSHKNKQITFLFKWHFEKTDYNSSQIYKANSTDVSLKYNWLQCLHENINQKTGKTRLEQL